MWLCKFLLSSRHTPLQKIPQSDSKLANSVNCWWGHPVTVQSPLPFFSAFCICMWIDEIHQQMYLNRAPLNPTHCNSMHAALTGSQSQSPPHASAFRPSTQTLTQALDPTKASSEPNCALKTGVQPGSDSRQPYRLSTTIIGTSGVTIARNLRWNSANSERQTRWIPAPWALAGRETMMTGITRSHGDVSWLPRPALAHSSRLSVPRSRSTPGLRA